MALVLVGRIKFKGFGALYLFTNYLITVLNVVFLAFICKIYYYVDVMSVGR